MRPSDIKLDSEIRVQIRDKIRLLEKRCFSGKLCSMEPSNQVSDQRNVKSGLYHKIIIQKGQNKGQ